MAEKVKALSVTILSQTLSGHIQKVNGKGQIFIICNKTHIQKMYMGFVFVVNA